MPMKAHLYRILVWLAVGVPVIAPLLDRLMHALGIGCLGF